MGYFLATSMAFVMNVCGIYIFCDPSVTTSRDPLVSSIIFLLSIFMVLYKLSKGYHFPSNMKLIMVASSILQFLLSAYVMEHAMSDFWYPLESSLFDIMPKIVDLEKSMWGKLGIPSYGFLDFMKNRKIHSACSYIISTFCLCVVVFKRGPGVILEDIALRMRKFFKKYYKNKERLGQRG